MAELTDVQVADTDGELGDGGNRERLLGRRLSSRMWDSRWELGMALHKGKEKSGSKN